MRHRHVFGAGPKLLMAFAALTVEADADTHFPNFRRLAASSSR